MPLFYKHLKTLKVSFFLERGQGQPHLQETVLPALPGPDGGTSRAAQDWWLQDRHHGIGNAPGTDRQSPTEPVDSDGGEMESHGSHRRRRMHAAHFDRHGPLP